MSPYEEGGCASKLVRCPLQYSGATREDHIKDWSKRVARSNTYLLFTWEYRPVGWSGKKPHTLHGMFPISLSRPLITSTPPSIEEITANCRFTFSVPQEHENGRP